MKKNALWYNIIYYNVIPIILSGICIFFFREYIYTTLWTFTSIDMPGWDTLVTEYEPMFDVALFAFWLYIVFTSLRSKRYKQATGRSYAKDHADFKKSYSTLMQFFTTNDPYKMDVENLPQEDWHTADGVILAKCKDRQGRYRLVKRDSNANGNLIAFGLPGSGKSTTQAATTAERFNAQLGGCGVFAISIKGDLLNFVHGKRKNIKIFTPDKAEGSCHYDPLLGVSQMSWTDRQIFAANLSIIICPEESGENSPYFVGGARDYLTAIILYLLDLHDKGKRSGDLKFPEIIDIILSNSVFELTLKFRDYENPLPGSYTNGHIGENEKNVAGIWSHLSKRIRPFNDGAIRILFDGEGDCITPDDLNTGDIYIDVPQDKYSVYAPCMAIIVTNFLQAFMQRDDISSGKKVVPIPFLLDEAVQLNLDFSLLSQAMATLRSKKTSVFLLMQSVAQLERRYGEVNARELMDLCAYVSVFNAQDPKSREYFQKLIGRRKMYKRSDTVSCNGNQKYTSTYNISISDEYIFEAADFGNLNKIDKKTKKITYQVLVYANGKYVLGETTPCYE